MKVVFITASAEPGKDGVGDYSRRLAAAIIEQGHQAVMLALNDKFVDVKLQETQTVDGVDIQVLRLPKQWGIGKQVTEAKPWLATYAPEWLSLQYVPFGFNPKGLPFGLSKWLKQLHATAKWHIMFHELWVGMAREESKKLIWWGRVQKLLVSSLISNLKAQVLHTQTLLYKAHLQQMGLKVNHLPLFGNIPVVTPRSTSPQANEIKFIVFGAIHSGGLITPFATQAAKYSKEKNIAVLLTFVGRCGEEQYRWAEIWKAPGLHVEILGEQSAERVSELLSSATAGINTTGLAVVEKSGAFAAMRDHGLPVISLSKPWTPFGVPPQEIPAGIVKYNGSNFENCLAGIKPYAANTNKVAKVAASFINELTAAIN